jgi:signal transduction histidine kinase
MPEASPDAVHALQERIKELSCLYEISNIAATSTAPLPEKLQEVTQALPKAWQHPSRAVAALQLDDQHYRSGVLALRYESQQHPIIIRGQERGSLAMHYNHKENPPPPFLHEEALLLKTLAQEIAGIIERDEQKARETLLRRKFEQADRLSILGEITAGIAHEMNTPLGNILGFAQLIQDRTDDQQVEQDVEKIINSSMHAREVVKKLMFFSCEIPQQKHLVDVGLLIEEALQLLRVTFEQAKVVPRVSMPGQPVLAQADPIQLTQVVFNLLINALHASKAGQEIWLTLIQNQDQMTLRIQDFGHGIEPDIRERIFEPFFSTKAPGDGSGLGLSVVHGIIKTHHGQIDVDSQPGQGTCFTIRLPLEP